MNTELLWRQIYKLERLNDAVSLKLLELARNNQPFESLKEQAHLLSAYISGLRDAAELIGYDPQPDIEAYSPPDLVYLYGARCVEWRNLRFAVSEREISLAI